MYVFFIPACPLKIGPTWTKPIHCLLSTSDNTSVKNIIGQLFSLSTIKPHIPVINIQGILFPHSNEAYYISDKSKNKHTLFFVALLHKCDQVYHYIFIQQVKMPSKSTGPLEHFSIPHKHYFIGPSLHTCNIKQMFFKY